MSPRPERHVLWQEAPIGLGCASTDGVVLEANDRLARTLGFPDASALIGSSLRAYSDFPELTADVIAERLEDDRLDGLELEIRKPDGSTAVIRLCGHYHRLPSGDVAVSFSAEDVTARHAEARSSSRGSKMEAVVRFAAGIAHDYNNLLTTIIGEARQLVAEHPAAAEGAGHVLSAARRASQITKRLLVFSRSEVARNEVVDIAERVGKVVDDFSATVGDDVEIVRRLDPMSGHIRIDPAHLKQILTNLAQNAVEAMPAGGRLVFETGLVHAPEDTHGMDFDPPVSPGAYAAVAIGDSGIGMNQETRSRAFDPFFTTKPIGGGAGLGLTSVYGHTTRSGGHVFIMSAPAHGTVVRLLFPLTEAPVAEAEAAPTVDDSLSPDTPTVLVVDDEASVLRVMSKILKRMGHRVIEASDGFSAKEIVRNHEGRIDLLVTDVMMPRMLGTALGEWVTKARPDTSVLLVSGYTDSPTVQEWVDRDPDVFLPKPFEPEEFMRAVNRRLPSPVASR